MRAQGRGRKVVERRVSDTLLKELSRSKGETPQVLSTSPIVPVFGRDQGVTDGLRGVDRSIGWS